MGVLQSKCLAEKTISFHELEGLVRDAALGRVEAVRKHLNDNPDQVNLEASSKTALQMASYLGHKAIVKILLR